MNIRKWVYSIFEILFWIIYLKLIITFSHFPDEMISNTLLNGQNGDWNSWIILNVLIYLLLPRIFCMFIFKKQMFISIQWIQRWILLCLGLSIVVWPFFIQVGYGIHLVIFFLSITSITVIIRVIWENQKLFLTSSVKNGIILVLSAWFVFILSNTYQLKMISTSSDEPYYLLNTHSLWVDLDLDLKNNFESRDYQNFYWEQKHLFKHQNMLEDEQGRWLTNAYGGVINYLLLPSYALFGRVGVVWFISFIAALVALFIFLIARQLNGTDMALWVWVTFILCVPWNYYTSQIYPEFIACFLVMLAIYCLFHIEKYSIASWLFLGALILLTVLRWRFLPMSLILFISSRLYIQTKAKRILWLVGFSFSCLSVWFVYRFYFNEWISLQRLGNFDHILSLFVNWSPVNTYYALASLFDQEHGLFIFAPIYLLIMTVGFLTPYKKYLFTVLGITLSYGFILIRRSGYEWYGSYVLCSRYFLILWALWFPLLVEVYKRIHIPIIRYLYLLCGIWNFFLWGLFKMNPYYAYHGFNGSFKLFEKIYQKWQINFWQFFPSFSEAHKYPMFFMFFFWLVIVLIIGLIQWNAFKNKFWKSLIIRSIISFGIIVGIMTLSNRWIGFNEAEAELMVRNNGKRVRLYDLNWFSSTGVLFKNKGYLKSEIHLKPMYQKFNIILSSYIGMDQSEIWPILKIQIGNDIFYEKPVASITNQWTKHYLKIDLNSQLNEKKDLEISCINCGEDRRKREQRILWINRWWMDA